MTLFELRDADGALVAHILRDEREGYRWGCWLCPCRCGQANGHRPGGDCGAVVSPWFGDLVVLAGLGAHLSREHGL